MLDNNTNCSNNFGNSNQIGLQKGKTRRRTRGEEAEEAIGDRERKKKQKLRQLQLFGPTKRCCKAATKRGQGQGWASRKGGQRKGGGERRLQSDKRKNAAFILMPLHALKKMRSNNYNSWKKLFYNSTLNTLNTLKVVELDIPKLVVPKVGKVKKWNF